MRSFFVMLFLSCGVHEVNEPFAQHRQALDAVTGFGTNPGRLLMYRFVPAGLPRGRPLVVLLHGCGDTATGFSSRSGFETQATQRQFAMLVPEQQTSNNVQTCFNWFDSANQTRGGELESIVQMIDRVATDVGSDVTQVFVAGFSAGGATAANFAAAYPDRLKAVAIGAGIPFKCTESFFGANDCINGIDSTPMAHGTRVRSAATTFTGPRARVAVWQGLADSFVSPTNRTELVQQWTNVHGIDDIADGAMPISSGGTRSFFRASPTTAALVELNEIPSLDHVWRSAWASDMTTFFGITAPVQVDGGTAGGAAGGAAGGSVAGGTAMSGGSAGGTPSAGGSAGGAAGGTPTAGGSAGGAAGGLAASGGAATAGGASSGGTATAGGLSFAGGTSGGGTTTKPPASCSTVGGPVVLVLGLLLARRRA